MNEWHNIYSIVIYTTYTAFSFCQSQNEMKWAVFAEQQNLICWQVIKTQRRQTTSLKHTHLCLSLSLGCEYANVALVLFLLASECAFSNEGGFASILTPHRCDHWEERLSQLPALKSHPRHAPPTPKREGTTTFTTHTQEYTHLHTRVYTYRNTHTNAHTGGHTHTQTHTTVIGIK